MNANNISDPLQLLLIDSKPKGIIIKCTFFKPNGKYYMDEDIIIPFDTFDFEIRDAIKANARMNHFIITGKGFNGVPFMVLNWNK